MKPNNPLRVAMVVGEASGDELGASLLISLKSYYPNIVAYGIGGPLLKNLGFNALFPMDSLSFMGIIEPLKNLGKILHIRRRLMDYFCRYMPDVFIGIDAPDFNLSVERRLKKAGIKTVHYVSPSIWAWRPGRIHKIKKAVDLMLCLLPFEPPLYHQHQVEAVFVGHPLAEQIPIVCDQKKARQQLSYGVDDKILAILPGSRQSEVKYLAPLFIKVARAIHLVIPQMKIIVPAVNQQRYHQFNHYLQSLNQQNNIHVVIGQSQTVMMASDGVLLSCGTAALEAMLIKRPMVVAYKLSPLVYSLGRYLIHTPYFSLPNILAAKPLVPEFIQHQATVNNLTQAVLQLFHKNHHDLIQQFDKLAKMLTNNASDRAATSILTLLARQSG